MHYIWLALTRKKIRTYPWEHFERCRYSPKYLKQIKREVSYMSHDSFYGHTFKRNLFGAPFANYFLCLRISQIDIWIFCVFSLDPLLKLKGFISKHLTTRIALVIGFRARLSWGAQPLTRQPANNFCTFWPFYSQIKLYRGYSALQDFNLCQNPMVLPFISRSFAPYW